MPNTPPQEREIREEFYEFSNPRKQGYEQSDDIDQFYPRKYNKEIADWWLKKHKDLSLALLNQIKEDIEKMRPVFNPENDKIKCVYKDDIITILTTAMKGVDEVKESVNFMQVGNGHCFICHKETAPNDIHKQCFNKPIVYCSNTCDEKWSKHNPLNKSVTEDTEWDLKDESVDIICNIRKGSMDDKQFRATVEHNISKARQAEQNRILKLVDELGTINWNNGEYVLLQELLSAITPKGN